MQQGMRSLPHVARFAPTVLLVVSLAGCTAFERGAEQGDPPTDAVTGCPDLSGSYAFKSVTDDGELVGGLDPEKPSRLEGGIFSPKGGRGYGAGDLKQYAGVVLRTEGTHAIELQFLFPHSHVMGELDAIRERERPRYAQWYSLMQPAGRAAFIASNGEPALQARLRELGPRTGNVVRLNRGPDFTCEDGWVILPREYLPPVRMTLDPGGHLVFESKELTYSVWGGWGDQIWEAPTGAYLGTARWPRDPSVRPWNADDAGQNVVFARPADEVEAEQQRFAEINRRNAELQFAAPEQIREALRPLLPDGVTVHAIEISSLPFLGPRVRVHAVPSDPSMDSEDQRSRLEWFLEALRDSDPSFIEDREVVKRVISSGGVQRHEFEIFLDTHPSVQPSSRPVVVSFTPAPGSASGVIETSKSPMASAESLPPSVPESDPTPPGFAPLSEVEARLQPLLAEGCRTVRLRYSAESVFLQGSADTQSCVSNTLRAIDGAMSDKGANVQLVELAADQTAGYRFEILLPPSSLTRA